MDGHFGSAHYIAELLPWAILAMALLLAAAFGLRHLAGRTARLVPAWLQAAITVAVLVVLWEHLFLLAYQLGPIGGCPDGGMSSGMFVLEFIHSGYIIDYIGMPLAARVAFHIVGASGFVLAGMAGGRLHYRGALGGLLVTAPFVLWRATGMWYTVVGYESDVVLTVDALLPWLGPLALQITALLAAGATVGVTLRRWRLSHAAPQPTPPTRCG